MSDHDLDVPAADDDDTGDHDAIDPDAYEPNPEVYEANPEAIDPAAEAEPAVEVAAVDQDAPDAAPDAEVVAEPAAEPVAAAAPAGSEPAPPDEQAPADEQPPADEADAAAEADAATAEAGADQRKPKKGRKPEQPAAESKPKKPAGPDPAEISRRVGTTNEAALRYVASPDPQLARLSRKAREALITEIPPVTAGALLGADALARHFIASAASGRYRDLFSLWELFRTRPDAVKPVLAERQRALERARQALTTAAKLGLRGRAERVAGDVAAAEGLIWTWLRGVLTDDLAAVGRRPMVVAALLAREPDLEIPLPDNPSDEWLAEAAAVKQSGSLPPALDALLSAHIDRLPATVATLTLVAENYPDRVGSLVERVDLDSPEIVAIMAWARDHGAGDRLRERIRERVSSAAEQGRTEGLTAWQTWRDRGVEMEMPASLRTPTIEGLDLTRPESAELVAVLISEGAPIVPQAELDALGEQNRQAAEKAYEAFVCAGLDVHLPLALEGNPIVKDGTRCPACQAWTWVRPGHEKRCPRLLAEQQEAPAAGAE